jgi:hypothetical protein
MDNNHLKSDKITKNILRKAGIEATSENFTDTLMEKIRAEAKVDTLRYEPIISKKVWYMIAASFFVIIFFLLFIGLSTGGPTGDSFSSVQEIITVSDLLNNMINSINFNNVLIDISITPMIPLCLISIWVLWFFDSFMKKLGIIK